MSTHARPLALWLASASDERLRALFAARGVRPDAAWSDFFDAAEALLEPGSIDRMLSRLTVDEAIALHGAADEAPTDGRAALIDLALLREDGMVHPEVADAVAARPAPEPSPATPQPPARESAAAHAAERTFTTVAAVADLLLLARETPLALLTGGALSAGEKRRLAETGLSTDDLDGLVVIAADAGLLQAADRRLHATAAGEEWLRRRAAGRWAVLAEEFRSHLPRALRADDGGWVPVPSWPTRMPWDAGWPAASRGLRERARLLGLVADDDGEPEWSASLRRGEPADPAGLRRMLPAEVDRIFLQNDLSAIAPGPLAPALDVRLRDIAARESAAQASSYRFTAESVSHALASGETAASILEFLAGLSLTGIPQPLEYLVTQTAQRHGLVRVSDDPASGRTRVASTDATLLDAMGVDQSLRPLGLTRDADGLSSRVGRDTVYWALTDARYPATIVGDDGRPQIIQRHALPDGAAAPEPSYDGLIADLRAHQGADADAAWLERELEAAVRTKALLIVEIEMPDGSTRELQLEASGLGGGRLRGLDRAADVERTLPVQSIRSARLAGTTS